MKVSKLKFTTKISTTKRPYAYILVYTPTPPSFLHPAWKVQNASNRWLSAFRILPTVPQ